MIGSHGNVHLFGLVADSMATTKVEVGEKTVGKSCFQTVKVLANPDSNWVAFYFVSTGINQI